MSEPHPPPSRQSDSSFAASGDVKARVLPWLGDELDIHWYVEAIRRRWPWVLAASLIGALGAFAYATTRAVQYEAVTTLMVAYPTTAAASAETSPQAFSVMVKNASLALELVQEIHLDQAPHSLTPQGFLERSLVVEPVAGTSVLQLRVRLQDPALAAEASRRFAQKVIALTRLLSQQEGSTVQEQLKGHLTAAASRLETSEKELLAFQQQAQVELLREDTQAMLDERGDLLKLVIAIESEKARLAAAEQEIKRQAPVLSVGRAVGSEEALRRLDARLNNDAPPKAAAATAEARRKAETGARDSLGERPLGRDTTADAESLDLTNPFVNPVYQTLDFQIASSRTRLAALEQERRQLVDVRKLGGDAFSRLSELYRRQIDLARLQTNFDLAKKVHSDLSVRFEESRTAVLGSSPQLQLVDPAITPDRPVSRRRGLLTVVGLLTGFLAMSLIVLTLEGWERDGAAR